MAQFDNYGLAPKAPGAAASSSSGASSSGGGGSSTSGTTSSNGTTSNNGYTSGTSNTTGSNSNNTTSNTASNTSGSGTNNSNTVSNTTSGTTGWSKGQEVTQNVINTNTSNMTPEALAALEGLIKQLQGGGTPASKMLWQQMQGELAALNGQRGDYSKVSAFSDAEGAVKAALNMALQKLMPSINNAAQGAGTSESSMRALLTQQAAANATDLAATKGLEASIAYGQINNGVGNNISNMLQMGDPNLAALISTLGIAKGAVTNSTVTENGTRTQTGTSGSNTVGNTTSNVLGTTTNQSTTNSSTTGSGNETNQSNTNQTGTTQSSGTTSQNGTTTQNTGSGGGGSSSGGSSSGVDHALTFFGPTMTPEEERAYNRAVINTTGGYVNTGFTF